MSLSSPRKLRLAQLSGSQALAAFARRPALLLPLGSHESHGPDLPMGDYMLADQIALAIAERAEQSGQACLVAPALPFGGADYFGSVQGGIALSQTTLRAVLTDMIGGLLRHGLDRLIVINGHGGNAAAIHEVTLAVRRRHGTVIPSLYLWKAARALMPQLGIDPAGRAGHGGDPLASIARYLLGPPDEAAPRVAPLPQHLLGIEVTDFASGLLDGAPVDLPVELDEIAPDGVAHGADPARATAEDGAALVEALVRIGADLVRRVRGLEKARPGALPPSPHWDPVGV